MSQWIDRPGPDDEPVVRVEDDLTDAGEHRQSGMDDVHGDVPRDRFLRGEETDVDDDVAGGLPGGEGGDAGDAGPPQRAGGEPAKKHGDPLR